MTRCGSIAAGIVILLSATAGESAMAHGARGGGHFGGHSAAFSGARSGHFSGSHFRHFSPRPVFINRPFVRAPIRRIILAAPLIAPLYYYPPAYYPPSAYYDAPPAYAYPPAYDYPSVAAAPAPYPPPPSAPAQYVEPRVAAPQVQTPIYYCHQTQLYTNDIRDKECPEGWKTMP